MADIMEILGEDPFRVSSYRKVARVIQECTQDVAVLAERGELSNLPGVGKSSVEKIQEFLETGRIQVHQDLLKKIPPHLLDLLKIPGFGPKGTAAVWKHLGIASLDDLQKAIENHTLETLSGFGEKKAALIEKGIRFLQSAQGRILIGHADALAQKIMIQLQNNMHVDQIVPAGSLRRGRETIGDIDLLACGKKQKSIIEAFLESEGVQQILSQGDTKASVRIVDPEICSETIQVDLRVVPKTSFGAAMQYFTGSKEHNVRLRELAVKKGWKLNEYGLFDGETVIAGKTEESIYKKLGLPFIPPPLREDRGEIEAALERSLPELVRQDDIRGDLHMHSPASDGHDSIEDLIEAALREHGYRYIAISDHSPSSVIANGLDARRLLKQIEKIRKLNKSMKGFTVFASSEVDIHPDGSLDYPDEILEQLDFVIASVHSGLTGDRKKNTNRILRAMDNPYVNCIGHLTGRMINTREPMDLDLEAIFQHAAKTHTALEVSASPWRLDLNDLHCRQAVQAGATLCINTDAHSTEGLYDILYGVLTAQRGWVTKDSILNTHLASHLKKWVARKRE